MTVGCMISWKSVAGAVARGIGSCSAGLKRPRRRHGVAVMSLDSEAPHRHDRLVPIYDYACVACDERFDELQRSDAPPPACPACGAEETQRLLSTFLVPNSPAGQRTFVRSMP